MTTITTMTPMLVLSHAVLRTKVAIIVFSGREREIQPRAIITDRFGREFVHAQENDQWRLFPIDKIENVEVFERRFDAEHYKLPEWATLKTARRV